MPPLMSTGWSKRPQGVATAVETAPVTDQFTLTLPTGLIETEGYRGIRVIVVGDTSADTFTMTITTVERSYVLDPDHKDPSPTYFSRAFCTNTGVMGNNTVSAGVSGGLLLGNEVVADTMAAFTLSAYAQKVLANFNGSADVRSPGSELIGELFISDLGNCFGVTIDFTTVSANYYSAIFKLDV